MASLMTIKLNKNVGTSWGFRLQGGKDFATPLCIQKVNGGSVAEKAGLQAGDAIVNISGQDALSLRHKEAQDAIVRAGNSFEIVIQRGSQIWRPQVTALPEVKMLPDGIPVATKTSLSASQRAYKPIGSGHNTTAAPFGELVNAQYNSPLNLYSDDSIAETLSAQAEVLGKGVLGINFKKYAREEKIRTDSPTYRLLHGEEEPVRTRPRQAPLQSDSESHLPFQRDPTEGQKATPPTHGQNAFGGGAGGDLHPGENICFACQRLIVGVFVRIKNKNLHAECFRCATCGSSLKNVGYYNINDKLYCDIHAKQAARAHPPAPNMEPIIIQPGAAPPSGALTTAQASKTRGPTTIHQPKHFAPAPAPAPAPFKPPVGGVRILPTTYSALNAPTPYKPEPEIPEPVAQEVPQQHPEPVNEPHITPEPQVVPQQAPPQAPHQHSGDEELPTAPSYSPALPAEVEGASQEETLPLPQMEGKVTDDSKMVVENVVTSAPPSGFLEEVVDGPGSEAPHSSTEERSRGDFYHQGDIVYQKKFEQSQEQFQDTYPKELVINGFLETEPQPALGYKYKSEPSQIKPESEIEACSTEIVPKLKPFSPSTLTGPPVAVEKAAVASVAEETALTIPPATVEVDGTFMTLTDLKGQSEVPMGTGDMTTTQFRSEESRFESQFTSSSSVVERRFDMGTNAPERTPVSAPAPQPYAPAPAPAPVPVVAAPPKPATAPAPAPAPVFRPTASSHGFGAPAGDIDVRAHIPKKGQRFEWPPRGAVQEVEEEPQPRPPAWAPVGEIPSIPRPVKPVGPPPTRPPLLPTPPPPKDYDSIVMKSTTVIKSSKSTMSSYSSSLSSVQSNFVESSSQSSSSGTAQISSSIRPIPIQEPPAQRASRFPNPAPALIDISPASSSYTPAPVKKSQLKRLSPAKAAATPVPTSTPTGPASAPKSNASPCSAPAGGKAPKTCTISPPKYVPVTAPMPSVKFESIPLPQFSEPLKPSLPVPCPIPVGSPAEPHSKPQLIPGFKPVSAPVQKKSPGPTVGFKSIKGPDTTPAPLPDDPSPAQVDSAPADPAHAPFPTATPPPCVPSNLPASTPALSESVAPKPVPSNPPAHAGAAPAPMTFAPAPVPAPIPGFGSNTMPKPAPPPHMGAMIGPGGSVRGVLQAPGQRSTPRRGRGVMNQASASRIPVCAICHRQIRGPFVSALGKTWCPDHFICATSTCRKNIIDMGFVEEQGGLYCEVCYENYLAPICGKCDKRIKGDCLNAVGKQFHPECFCCAYCGKVFGSGAFYLEDGLPYCETDWNDLFTTKCVGCNFPIEAGDRWVEALNNNYHSQCFKCSKCNVNLEGQSFFAKGGKPFCKAHAQRGF